MVRDARTRGTDARQTIGMWSSVRRGEEENIFPYQEDADVVFNSALDILSPFITGGCFAFILNVISVKSE